MALDHAFEDVLEVSEWLDVVEPGSLDQGSDDGPGLGAAVGAGEQVVLPSQGDRRHGRLDGVGVDLDAAVVEEPAQTVPAGQSIADRLAQLAFGGDLGGLGLEPGLEGLEDGPAPLPPQRLPPIGVLPADLCLDAIPFGNGPERLGGDRRLRGLMRIVELAPGTLEISLQHRIPLIKRLKQTVRTFSSKAHRRALHD